MDEPHLNQGEGICDHPQEQRLTPGDCKQDRFKRSMMRFVVLPLALLTSAANAAEPVDCDAIAKGTTAAELSYHDGNDNPSVIQVSRDTSGNAVAWIKTLNGKLVTKAVLVDGILATAEITSAFAGKFKSSKITYNVKGMPKHFDRRTDLKYTIAHSTIYSDGSTDEASVTIDYRFKSAGTESAGPCMLDAVHGETDSVNEKTGRTSHTYSVYFPQLMAVMTGRTAEPVLDDIKTKFDPMTMIP